MIYLRGTRKKRRFCSFDALSCVRLLIHAGRIRTLWKTIFTLCKTSTSAVARFHGERLSPILYRARNTYVYVYRTYLYRLCMHLYIQRYRRGSESATPFFFNHAGPPRVYSHSIHRSNRTQLLTQPIIKLSAYINILIRFLSKYIIDLFFL